MYNRELLRTIRERCFRGKAIIVVGARQVGKTTLLRSFAAEQSGKVLFLNCDEPQTALLLENRNVRELQMLVGQNSIVVVDEAQRVSNIGLTIKLIVDSIPNVQVIATGSSAFELRNSLNEPLTGRKFEYMLFPISTAEIIETDGLLEAHRLLGNRLIYGSYPDILTSDTDAAELLRSLTDSYLYKDILSSDNLRKPDLLDKLIRALAYQVGEEVSYNELALTIGTSSKTVERYVELLEKCFVVFRLNGLSRNARNELKKSKKIYFYDNGVRNAVIRQFQPLDMRNDVGALWENFFISERLKFNHYRRSQSAMYFWRTKSQQEIDLVEETNGKMRAFEMKWNVKKANVKCPAAFCETYEVESYAVVTPQNYIELLT